MSEVARLQLICLSVVGSGILILLFIKSVFPRVIGFVSIVLGSEHSPAKHRCVDGLNRAIEELRSRGSRVSVTDWHPANER